jgi:hypothetical protein
MVAVRGKQLMDINVYEAAKQRINHILDIFDNVAVSFSGGKDSLVVLSLVEEVYAERGMDEKVKVVFRDEELIKDVAFANYPRTIQGVYAYARDTITDANLLDKAERCIKCAELARAKIRPSLTNGYDGYPIYHVFRCIATGNVKRANLMPIRKCDITKKMIDFENGL